MKPVCFTPKLNWFHFLEGWFHFLGTGFKLWKTGFNRSGLSIKNIKVTHVTNTLLMQSSGTFFLWKPLVAQIFLIFWAFGGEAFSLAKEKRLPPESRGLPLAH